MDNNGQYQIGELVRLAARFFDKKNANLDPAAITLKVKRPDGTITPYTYLAGAITRDAKGLYHKDLSLDVAGQWVYRFEATGAGQSAGEKRFTVVPSEFA